jgi:AraC-like DNA-binding protein
MEKAFTLYDFIATNENIASFEGKFAILDLSKISGGKRRYVELQQPLALRGILMVTGGEMNIDIDGVYYCLKENMMLIFEGQHIVSSFYASEGCEGHCLIFDNDYLEMLVHEERPPCELMINIRLTPVVEFNKTDFAILRSAVERIYSNIRRADHAFLSAMFRNELRIFNYELWNAVLHNRHIKVSAITPYEQTATGFIKLLHDNFRTEHEVIYYASTLCVSSVFLTRAMKKATKKTAGQWIDEILVAEAKIMLRKPDRSIKEIAEELHFSDQASFSKFFKKNTGLSPIGCRKRATERG